MSNIRFRLQCQFQRLLYQTLCVFSQITDRNILNRIIILLLGSCLRGGTWGVLLVKIFSMGNSDGALSTAHSSLLLSSA